jgi:hypothetical protein
MPALAQEIPDRPVCLRINVAFRQDAEPHHLRQPEGIMPIISVVRRLDGDVGDVVSERSQGIDNNRGIVRQLSVESSFAVLVDDADITVA